MRWGHSPEPLGRAAGSLHLGSPASRLVTYQRAATVDGHFRDVIPIASRSLWSLCERDGKCL
jgi:hypothetical protein